MKQLVPLGFFSHISKHTHCSLTARYEAPAGLSVQALRLRESACARTAKPCPSALGILHGYTS